MKKQTILATGIALFALLTLFMTISVIFDLFGIRAAEGNYVPVVLWANFVCGFLYLGASWLVMKNDKRSFMLLLVAVVLLVLTFGALGMHIIRGNAYEIKTVFAMIFRISLSVLFTILVYYTIIKHK